MTRLLIATTNRDKLREIQAILDPAGHQLTTLLDMPPIEEPEETGATFQDNARLKAFHYAREAATVFRDPEMVTVAEDSGLMVDALGGDPGVQSARFLRPDATYTERFEEIYRRLAAVPTEPRTARFICAIAAVRNGSLVFETTGLVEGEICPEPRGTNGFGYDPIFLYPPFGQTLAEVDDQRKLTVAHRGHAFRKFAEWMKPVG